MKDNESGEISNLINKKIIIPVIDFNSGNYSNSIIRPHGAKINNNRGIYMGRYKNCSVGGNFYNGGRSHRKMELPHTFELSWFHKLSGNTYTATMKLDVQMVRWAFLTYLPSKLKLVKTNNSPSISVLYRTRNRVEAWLVILGDTSVKTAIKLGEAVGIIKNQSDRKYPTYENLANKTRGSYRAGTIYYYDRSFDQTLNLQQRFGCYHDKNDIPIGDRYPVRYPSVVDLKGEFHQCKEHNCHDYKAQIKKWKKLVQMEDKNKGSQRSYTKNNPSKLLKFRKLSRGEYRKWRHDKIDLRHYWLKQKEKVWVCLAYGEPCFKGIKKDYGTNRQ